VDGEFFGQKCAVTVHTAGKGLALPSLLRKSVHSIDLVVCHGAHVESTSSSTSANTLPHATIGALHGSWELVQQGISRAFLPLFFRELHLALFKQLSTLFNMNFK
jgi:hypothetical protein